jgi:hypothetical protein
MLRIVDGPDPLEQLIPWIDELARKWERFFTHDPQVPHPPERERAALERRLRELSRDEGRNTQDRFRLDQLLHRFSVYNQLWQRQLRDREEARTTVGSNLRSGRAASLSPNENSLSPVQPVEVNYGEVFTRFCRAQEKFGRKVSISLDRFRAALEQQRGQIEAKGGIVEGFDLVEEGDQVKVRARVRRRRS